MIKLRAEAIDLLHGGRFRDLTWELPAKRLDTNESTLILSLHHVQTEGDWRDQNMLHFNGGPI